MIESVVNPIYTIKTSLQYCKIVSLRGNYVVSFLKIVFVEFGFIYKSH